MITRRADLRAADPRVEGVVGPFDFRVFQVSYSINTQSGLTVQPDQIAAESLKSLGLILRIMS